MLSYISVASPCTFQFAVTFALHFGIYLFLGLFEGRGLNL